MINQSLDAFFKSNDKVLVIKGKWGVGKTFLWDQYIKSRIDNKDLQEIAYSYISLFGKNSLSDVRASIFQSASPISTDKIIEEQFDEQIKKSTGLLKRVPWVRDTQTKISAHGGIVGFFTNLARSAPVADKYSSLIASLEYRLVNNYIVCFDDLERKSKSLSIREIMGLADELAHSKKCKVILIFNNDSLSDDKDKDDFDTYREKVVDIELNFNPTHTQNLTCIFKEDHPAFDKLEELTKILDIKNIRVLKKIKRIIDHFWPELEKSNNLIIEEFLNHAILLCWSYYMRDAAISFDFLKYRINESSWGTYFSSKNEEIADDEKRYREIASAIRLSPSPLIEDIINFLEQGYTDLNQAQNKITKLVQKIEVERARKELDDVWKKYSDTFADNRSEIINSFNEILKKHADKLSISEFSGAIDMLIHFGEDVTSHVDKYISVNDTEITRTDIKNNLLARGGSNNPLLKKIKEVQIETTKFNIDQLAMKVAINRGWNPDELNFLASITADEIYNWIKTNPTQLPEKLQGGLLFFGTIQSSDDNASRKFKSIYENTKTALEKIASESDLNKMRVEKIYRINIPDEQMDVAVLLDEPQNPTV